MQRLNSFPDRPVTTADSTTLLISQRNHTHGDYSEQALITENIVLMMAHNGDAQHSRWLAMTPGQRHALTLIATKIGRILAGDPDFRDHWDDIAGYARLVAERCSK